MILIKTGSQKNHQILLVVFLYQKNSDQLILLNPYLGIANDLIGILPIFVGNSTFSNEIISRFITN